MKFISCLILLFFSLTGDGQVLRKRIATLMGGRFDITIVAADSLLAEKAIDKVIAEVSRIENLISDWKPESQVSQINSNAGVRPVRVDKEVFELTRRALSYSEITAGAFDISFAAMDRIWKFDGSMTEMPGDIEIKNSVKKVGYKNIILDSIHSTIFLRLPGMKIGFGALGEGYAADQCRTMMLSEGITAGIVNATGDMSTWGKQPNGHYWNIGITNPLKKDKLFAVVPLKQGSVTTSGSYEKFVSFNGKRYSHIINPVTGYPATGVMSVTVFGPGTEMANFFSTSLMLLGKKKGLMLIRRYPAFSCILVTDDGKIKTTRDLKKYRKRL